MTTDNATRTTADVMWEYAVKYGAREVHCKHREHGICGTPSGYTKKACQDEVDAMVAEGERLMLGDVAMVFPTIQAWAGYYFDPERQRVALADFTAEIARTFR